MMSQLYGTNLQENKSKDKEMYSNISYEEQVMRMLQLHNSKVEKILKGYKEGYDQRKKAKGGVTLDDSKKLNTDVQVIQSEKSHKKTLGKKKPKVSGKKDLEVVIKVKGQDGTVHSYDEKESQDSSRSEKENEEEKSKKKATKKKGTKKKSSTGKI